MRRFNPWRRRRRVSRQTRKTLPGPPGRVKCQVPGATCYSGALSSSHGFVATMSPGPNMTEVTAIDAPTPARRGNPLEVFVAFLRLGLTSFGGPIAHLGYFRQEFVARRHWLDEAAYADLVALCQFLPGPASSEVGIGIGLTRAGLAGALAAWTGFTLPSAIALVLFALGVERFGALTRPGCTASRSRRWRSWPRPCGAWPAPWPPARRAPASPSRRRRWCSRCRPPRGSWAPSPWARWPASCCCGAGARPRRRRRGTSVGRGFAILCLVVFFALLAGLPLLAAAIPNHALAMFNAFYRAGALVFGGGHVVLPLLQAAVVPPGWVTNDAFLAGYGAAQAVPGPLFTFAAYLGAVDGPRAERLGRRRDLPGRRSSCRRSCW